MQFIVDGYQVMEGSGMVSTLQSRVRGSLPSTRVVAVALIVTTEKQSVRMESETQSSES